MCLIGVRSLKRAKRRARRLACAYFPDARSQTARIRRHLREAREIACTGTAGYGISVDLDAIDPLEAPGVGSPVRGGIGAAEVVNALARHSGDPALRTRGRIQPHLDRGANDQLVPTIAEALLSPQRAFEFTPLRRAA
jgi:arginase